MYKRQALKNIYAEPQIFSDVSKVKGETIVLVDAINHAIDEELSLRDLLKNQ